MALTFSIMLVLLGTYLLMIRRVYVIANRSALNINDADRSSVHSYIQIKTNKNILNAALWLACLINFSVVFVLLSNIFSDLVLFLLYLVVIGYEFVYLNFYTPSRLSFYLARKSLPLSAAISKYANKYIGFIARYFPASKENKSLIYSDDDLVELLKNQQEIKTNRIDEGLLKRLVKLIKNYEKTAYQIMTKLDEVKKIDANEEIGPVIIDELHKTGSKYFLVSEGDEFVGYLKLRDLISLKKTGKVRTITNRDLDYIDRSSDIGEVVELFLNGSSPVFLVRDENETIGFITIEEILKSLLSSP